MKLEFEKNKNWFYSEKVKEHFFNPKNIIKNKEDLKKLNPNGHGKVGNPTCGDIMEMWIKVENGKIKKCKWRTFGCASAIASTSILSEMVTKNGGMKIEEAMKIKPKDIVNNLNGLPSKKIHCSVLGDQALRAAIKDYLEKN